MKEEAIEVGIVQATFSQVFGLIGLLTLASLLLPWPAFMP